MSWLVRKDMDHNKTFEVRVRIGGQPYGSGKGRSKKLQSRKLLIRRSSCIEV